VSVRGAGFTVILIFFLFCRSDRARGAGNPPVSADPVQDRLPPEGGQLPVGHVTTFERGRAIHQVLRDRTSAVQAQHHDAVELTSPWRR